MKHGLINDDIRIPKYCGSWGWYNVKTKTTSPYYCGSFRCGRDICKRKAYLRRVTEIQNDVNTHKLDRFFTLTLDRTKIPTDVNPWDYIKHVWLKFRKRIHRQYDNFKYVAVLESHKDRRYPHIHGFTNTYIPYDVYKKQWMESGGGWMVSVCKVDDGEVAQYVSKQLDVVKYVGKQQLEDAYSKKPYGARTIWRSKGIKEPSAKKDLTKEKEWYILKECVYNSEGKQIRFVEDGSNGDSKCQGKDMEGAQCAISEESIGSSFENMEAQETEASREVETYSFAFATCEDKSGNKENNWKIEIEQESSTYG